eukprot:CAMPEP_0172493198 /NCGR_PEP_ID=MMETSP1066-20121228/24573_1 /TAXON_ID=671091 /ORGANISM="Coscinodiscus wailesii, Strain CCMP2513" /LENGTH=324 /DNA_ID=CAMNT_0013263245 /DNA_START=108 /DNA_END=1079 /DNA_ORIENTATION=+
MSNSSSSSNATTPTPQSLSCTICSLNHGTTLWPDGTITNFTFISDLTRNYGPEYNLTCPAGYECVPSNDNDGDSTTLPDTGCCIRCAGGKYCSSQSISYDGLYLESNVCPDGYTCDYDDDAADVAVPNHFSTSYITPCPQGMICHQNNTMNCTEVARRSIYRELLQGMYCPNASSEMLMCPKGYSCETPESIEVCEAKYFCMGKTESLWLQSPCPAGAQKLCRRLVHLVPMVFALIFIFGGMFFLAFIRRKRDKIAGYTAPVFRNVYLSLRYGIRGVSSVVKEQMPKKMTEMTRWKSGGLRDYTTDRIESKLTVGGGGAGGGGG